MVTLTWFAHNIINKNVVLQRNVRYYSAMSLARFTCDKIPNIYLIIIQCAREAIDFYFYLFFNAAFFPRHSPEKKVEFCVFGMRLRWTWAWKGGSFNAVNRKTKKKKKIIFHQLPAFNDDTGTPPPGPEPPPRTQHNTHTHTYPGLHTGTWHDTRDT